MLPQLGHGLGGLTLVHLHGELLENLQANYAVRHGRLQKLFALLGQALMFGIRGEVRLLNQRVGDSQAGLAIARAVGFFASVEQVIAQAEQPLRRYRRC